MNQSASCVWDSEIRVVVGRGEGSGGGRAGKGFGGVGARDESLRGGGGGGSFHPVDHKFVRRQPIHSSSSD